MKTTRHRLLGLMAVACLVALTFCGLRFAFADGAPISPLPLTKAKPVDFDGLKNVLRLSEKIYSGGAPEGDAGFLVLKKLGVKTLATVDGAKPDVARAKSLGMRYFHFPCGYDGSPVPTAN